MQQLTAAAIISIRGAPPSDAYRRPRQRGVPNREWRGLGDKLLAHRPASQARLRNLPALKGKRERPSKGKFWDAGKSG
jgi:hypothetical protein